MKEAKRMYKKIFFWTLLHSGSHLFGMFGVLPGAVPSAAGSAGTPTRLAPISEVASLTSAAVGKSAKITGKKFIEKPLKPRATSVVVRHTKIKPKFVAIDLYDDQRHIKGLPICLFENLNLAGLLNGDRQSFKDFQKQTAPWAIVDELTLFVSELKDQKEQR